MTQLKTLEGERFSAVNIPGGFEKYFEDCQEIPPIRECTNLLHDLQIDQPELGRQMKRLEIWQLDPVDEMERHLIFMETSNCKRALMVICQDQLVPAERHHAYGTLSVIGGTGVYSTPEDRSPIEFALEHTLSLALAMRHKTTMSGLRRHFGLSGMKATVVMESGKSGLSDWEKSSALQEATGWLYSPQRLSRALTGTDARQTPETIGAMARGSALAVEDGRNAQICGTRENFDTPGACRYSMEATIDALIDNLPDTPDFKDSVVSIPGFGRIGYTAVKLALDRGARQIYLSDMKLPVDELGIPLITDPEFDQELYQRLLELQEDYPGQKVVLVAPNDIYRQKADIFMPCSSQEEQLTEITLKELKEAGVKVVLAGANNILKKGNKWQLANLAAKLGMVMPPEVLSNCGSVTMAGMERLYFYLRETDTEYMELPDDEAEKKFVREHVIPFVRDNAQEMISTLLEIAREMKTDIYTAGEIWYLRQFEIEANVDENGVLQNIPAS